MSAENHHITDLELTGTSTLEKPRYSVETEPTAEAQDRNVPFDVLQLDLQQNYTEHLRNIENASLGVLDGVVRSAQTGFRVSLVLNVASFILGLGIIVIGLVLLIQSPESFGRVVGIASSLAGLLLVLTLLFWRGPLDRILESVSNLARINVVTIGLAHRLNQVSRVFVQESLKGKMTVRSLNLMNGMIDDAVRSSVEQLGLVLPKETAEAQVSQLMQSLSMPPEINQSEE